MKEKAIFLALKGIGDTIILINFLNRNCQNIECVVIISKRLLFLKKYFNESIHIHEVDDNLSSIYFLKKKYLYLPQSIIKLRNIIKYYAKNNYKLIHFDDRLKNKLFFIGIDQEIQTNNNVYLNYELFFKDKLKLNFCYKKGNIIIFPFGDSTKRRLNINHITYIDSNLNKLGLNFNYLIHESDRYKKELRYNKNVIHYSELNSQFDKLISKYTSVITVDTFFLHYAILKNMNTYVISDSWHNYIHDEIFRNDRFYSKSDINKLLSSLENEHV